MGQLIGLGLWLNVHIGVVSNVEGYYYAMDDSAANMVHKPISNQKWVKVIKLCDIEYTAETEEGEEMVDTTNISVNGKSYTINRKTGF